VSTLSNGAERSKTCRLAIVMPVLNESARIDRALGSLQSLHKRGARLVVVDGGSSDDTVRRARRWTDLVLAAPGGRAAQMNAGAASVEESVDVFLFLHADTELPEDADRLVEAARARGGHWGRFDVRIEGRSPILDLVACLMNLRSRLTGICTGDQAIFVERALFVQLGGYADQALMEDLEFSRRARKFAWPAAIAARATTSGRRWEKHGVWRTILLMWSLRWRYWCGEDPSTLARRYREVR
jgi:rSAM/selenodomain-associated transferase 2